MICKKQNNKNYWRLSFYVQPAFYEIIKKFQENTPKKKMSFQICNMIAKYVEEEKIGGINATKK